MVGRFFERLAIAVASSALLGLLFLVQSPDLTYYLVAVAIATPIAFVVIRRADGQGRRNKRQRIAGRDLSGGRNRVVTSAVIGAAMVAVVVTTWLTGSSTEALRLAVLYILASLAGWWFSRKNREKRRGLSVSEGFRRGPNAER